MELIDGESAFEGASAPGVMAAILAGQRSPLTQVR
jgi:hypothetical protein